MKIKMILCATIAAALGVCALASADEHGREGDREAMSAHGAMQRGEAHEGPRGYQRVQEPHGWDARPQNVDRDAYRHNYQAARSFHVGPYHAPPGWHEHRWVYGEILPRAYWAPRYILADYWLFALEVPPVGFEWVRVGADALLISIASGEVLQVEYGVFA
jgi:Ni/Co efflux regulator RcnB